MDQLPPKYQQQVQRFISEKLSLAQEGAPHHIAELAQDTIRLTRRLPMDQCKKTEVVNYIYQQVSTNETNGFKPEYDFNAMINVLQTIQKTKCFGCFK